MRKSAEYFDRGGRYSLDHGLIFGSTYEDLAIRLLLQIEHTL